MFVRDRDQAGVTLQHLREAGVNVSVLAVKQRLEGASAFQLAHNGFNYWEIKDAGCSLMSAILRPGELQEDSLCALVEILSGNNCDNVTFAAILEEDLLGGIRYILHNNQCNKYQGFDDICRVKRKAVEMIPLLIAKGISCPALLVHSDVLAPLLGLLALPEHDSTICRCSAARAVTSMSTAAVPKSKQLQCDTGHERPGSLETVLEEVEEVEADEISFHEMLLSTGVLQLLGQMSYSTMSCCRFCAITSLRTILLSSGCGSSEEENSSFDSHNAIHKSQKACLKSFYAADGNAVDALVSCLAECVEHDNHLAKQSGSICNKGHMSSADYSCLVTSCIEVLRIIVVHPVVKSALTKAGVVRSLVLLLGQETTDVTGHDNGRLSTTVSVSVLAILLRQLSWYSSENMMLLVEQEGLQHLTLCLRMGKLNDASRAEVIWILNDAVAVGAPALLAIGAVDQVLLEISKIPHCNLVLEAALAVINAMLKFDNHKYLFRLLTLAGNLNVTNFQQSPPSSFLASEGSISETLFLSECLSDNWLTTRLREIAGSKEETKESFNVTCRSSAANCLHVLEVNHII